jgi:hypothetical protein
MAPRARRSRGLSSGRCASSRLCHFTDGADATRSSREVDLFASESRGACGCGEVGGPSGARRARTPRSSPSTAIPAAAPMCCCSSCLLEIARPSSHSRHVMRSGQHVGDGRRDSLQASRANSVSFPSCERAAEEVVSSRALAHGLAPGLVTRGFAWVNRLLAFVSGRAPPSRRARLCPFVARSAVALAAQ